MRGTEPNRLMFAVEFFHVRDLNLACLIRTTYSKRFSLDRDRQRGFEYKVKRGKLAGAMGDRELDHPGQRDEYGEARRQMGRTNDPRRVATVRARSPSPVREAPPPEKAPDGSPIFKLHAVTLSESTTLLLTSSHELQDGCGWVPQRGAALGNCTFYLNLHKFPAGLMFGDLTCDGYEPWRCQRTDAHYFLCDGYDFQRVCGKVSVRRF